MAVFIVKHIDWKKWAYILLLVIISIDILSIYLTSSTTLVLVRAFHGVTGGLLVGIGFAVISRTENPDKTFGYLLLI